ncbi:MAG: hypothetical protein AAF787_01120 [Chloroflexota bacterium]
MVKIGERIYEAGDDLQFEAVAFGTGEPVPCESTIRALAGGGFYGKVLIFDDYVIKTAMPDPWHHFWRTANFRSPVFPPQASEAAARLDHLAMQIIHLTISVFSEGEIYAPRSLGYTWVESVGYAQIIERMTGRGVRFDVDGENSRFAAAREQIWQYGLALGIEHAAQVHPRNPFGKPNLWIGPDDRMIWLDTLPAIPHTGFVLPAFYFRFHREVRETIGKGGLTFNRIHTSQLREYIAEHPGFDASDGITLDSYLDEYDRVMVEYEEEQRRPVHVQTADDALKRGTIDTERGEKLRQSRWLYRLYMVSILSGLLVGSFLDFLKERWVVRIFINPESRRNFIRFFRDREYRKDKTLEETIMRGVTKAYEHGVLNESECQRIWQSFEAWAHQEQMRRLAVAYLFLQTTFLVSGVVVNSLSIMIVGSALLQDDPLRWVAVGVVVDWVLPPVIRALLVLLVWLRLRINLRVLLLVAMIPKVGSYLAVAADLSHRFGTQSEQIEQIWHYSKRYLISTLSRLLRPWGGWNTDLEERLWRVMFARFW